MLGRNQEETKLITSKGKFRIIGCTTCWGFSNLKLRKICGCSVC